MSLGLTCSIAPTSGDCGPGADAVNQMDSVFQSAPAAVQANFQSAHDSIMSQFNSVYSWYSSWIPLNPDCETVCNLGVQAVALMNQIQAAMGQSPTPSTPGGGINLTGSATMIIIVLGVAFLLLNKK
jgi:hypothetical protein